MGASSELNERLPNSAEGQKIPHNRTDSHCWFSLNFRLIPISSDLSKFALSSGSKIERWDSMPFLMLHFGNVGGNSESPTPF